MHGKRPLPHMKEILANPQIVGALIALSGFIVAGLSSWALALINRRYDERRNMRDLALKAAIAQWEHDVARIKAHNEKVDSQGSFSDEPKWAELTTMDFDMILVQKLKLIEVFGSDRITGRDVERGWREMSDVANAIRDCRNRHKSGK
jgi:hypothetical protein